MGKVSYVLDYELLAATYLFHISLSLLHVSFSLSLSLLLHFFFSMFAAWLPSLEVASPASHRPTRR